MLLLLQAFFGSWRLAALGVLVLPLGVTGGLLALAATGGKLSFGAYIALFAIFGLGARSAVALLDGMRRLQREEPDLRGPALVAHAARDRVAPVLTTAVATFAVFLPVLSFGGEPGFELLRPASVVLLGGLLTTALVALYALPLLYARFGFAGAADPSAQELELEPPIDEVPDRAPVVT